MTSGEMKGGFDKFYYDAFDRNILRANRMIKVPLEYAMIMNWSPEKWERFTRILNNNFWTRKDKILTYDKSENTINA